MSEELMPCPWCGEPPEIVEYDDGCFGVACRSHGWTGYDGNGIRTSADVAVYAEARLDRDPETGEVSCPSAAAILAKEAAVAAWNRRVLRFAYERDPDWVAQIFRRWADDTRDYAEGHARDRLSRRLQRVGVEPGWPQARGRVHGPVRHQRGGAAQGDNRRDGGETMLKAMISQPMAGKTDEEIMETRERAKAELEEIGYEFVNTLFTDEWYSDEAMKERGVVQVPLCYLAKSLENMSKCHAVYFCKGWKNARGCRIEHDAAVAYGLAVLYED